MIKVSSNNSKIIGGLILSIIGGLISFSLGIWIVEIIPELSLLGGFMVILQGILLTGGIITFVGAAVVFFKIKIGKIIIWIGGILGGINYLIIMGASIIIPDMSKYNKGIATEEELKKNFIMAIILTMFGPILFIVMLEAPLGSSFTYLLFYSGFSTIYGIICIYMYYNNPEFMLRLMNRRKWKKLIKKFELVNEEQVQSSIHETITYSQLRVEDEQVIPASSDHIEKKPERITDSQSQGFIPISELLKRLDKKEENIKDTSNICKSCGKELIVKAGICPHCGKIISSK